MGKKLLIYPKIPKCMTGCMMNMMKIVNANKIV